MVEKDHFGRGKKTCEDNTQCLAISAYSLIVDEKTASKKVLAHTKSFPKYLERVHLILIGNYPKLVLSPTNNGLLAKGLIVGDYLRHIILNMEKLEFESRKTMQTIISEILRLDMENEIPNPLALYFLEHKAIIVPFLIAQHDSKELSVIAGKLLKSFIKSEILIVALLDMEIISELVNIITNSTFDVASNIFDILSTLLTYKGTEHHECNLVNQFLFDNYDKVMETFIFLMNQENYFGKREGLKLLFQILVDPKNMNILENFTSEAENLKLIMTILLAKSKAIQYEAFSILELIVSCPKKSPTIIQILKNNKDKLLEFVVNFQNDRDDFDFQKDKKLLLNDLKNL